MTAMGGGEVRGGGIEQKGKRAHGQLRVACGGGWAYKGSQW